MKRTCLALLCIVLTLGSAIAQTREGGNYDIIPRADTLIKHPGFFPLNDQVVLQSPDSLQQEARLLKRYLFKLLPAGPSSAPSGSISFIQKPEQINALGVEGYHLRIRPEAVTIIAATKAGAIHGLFTLLQLQQIQNDPGQLPCVDIKDHPHFPYRGMHLDVSRHFFPVSFIKHFLDMMALYKLNTFHWHLTDGAGWRLQIKKYPKLTSEAAWRTNGRKLRWTMRNERFLKEGDPNAYGGYYTQKEAREIVAYAAKRGITVIPEIEMPAHSGEVLAVYPELSCSGIPYKNTEFCIGNDSTFIFLKDVLSEVMDIFPSKYIHIGGDEASMRSWKTCPKDQQLMKKMGFTQVAQLQSYAIKKIERFLSSHGRKLLGWDEILKGGLPPEATVMSWRGEAGGIAAARQGHDVIMTPSAYCYFDHYQSDPNTQPKTIGGFIPLRKIYGYDPVPVDSLTAAQQRHILGLQATLWSEYMPTTDQVEYMAFPRMLALAETGWSAPEKKNFTDFHRRLQSQYRLLQRHHINYYRPSNRLHIQATPNYTDKSYTIRFHSEQYDPVIYYTLNGPAPDPTAQRYAHPFHTTGKTHIQAAIFKDGIQQDSTVAYTANYHKAIGKKVTYQKGGWSRSYPAQYSKTLTDGITGSLTYQDQQWQGFLHDMDVIVDMGSPTVLHQLSMRFMQLTGPGVYIPNAVTVLLSDDGQDYHPVGTVKNDVPAGDPSLRFKTFAFDLHGTQARYIRIKVDIQRGFMFTDEIMVN